MTENELKLIRKALGWTQEKLASRLGVDRKTVVRNEQRDNSELPETMRLAARYINEHPEHQLELQKQKN